MSNGARGGLIGVVVVFGVLVILALLEVPVPLPPPWLEAWTKWIATAVGIIVSARVLWAGAQFIAKKAL